MFDVKKMGEQIAYLRAGKKWTQEQLAEILKVSPQAVSKWENGKAAPEIPLLCEMSRLFDCSVDRILDPTACVLQNMGFDYEFVVKSRLPVADYSGPEWPKSISSASVLTAFFSHQTCSFFSFVFYSSFMLQFYYINYTLKCPYMTGCFFEAAAQPWVELPIAGKASAYFLIIGTHIRNPSGTPPF